MDDLLALFDASPPEAEEDAEDESQKRHDSRSKSKENHLSGSREHPGAPTTTKSREDQISASADEKTGIRMTNRVICGADLLELLISNPYHSPASLCAMSLATLNTLLTDPAVVIDQATVCGKTNIITAGIVFSNSGTRVSSSGNAFCVLTLGNLNTGPSITCMLFGAAYGQFCRRCQPGKVIALLGPRLLPPKTNNNSNNNNRSSSSDTAVSFSVSEDRQIRIVADARDFGVCKAMVRGKEENGRWVSDAKRCNHYVDTRVSEYCRSHRKLENKNVVLNNGSKSNSNSTTTAMMHLRKEASLFPRTDQGKKTLILPGGNKNLPASQQGDDISSSRPLSEQMMSKLERQIWPSSLPIASAPSRAVHNNKLLQLNNKARPALSSRVAVSAARPGNNNSLLHPPVAMPVPSQHHIGTIQANPSVAAWNGQLQVQVQPRQRDPKRLNNSILNPGTRQPPSTTNPPPSSSTSNPYTKKAQQQQPQLFKNRTPSAVVPSTSRQSSIDPADWLQQETKRRAATAYSTSIVGKRKKPKTTKDQGSALNTDTTEFNGSVMVPKPSLRSFMAPLQRATMAAQKANTNTRDTSAITETQRQEILVRQNQVAARLVESKKEEETLPMTSSAQSKSSLRPRVTPLHGDKSTAGQDDRCQALFGLLGDVDLEMLRSAKSKFSSEAEAEDYAMRRNRVVELEKEEEKRGAKRQDECSKTNKSLIQKEWHCKNCNQTYKSLPRKCQRANHNLLVRRTIEESKTADEKRQALSDKKVEEGGLRLGSGLEWSRWSRFG